MRLLRCAGRVGTNTFIRDLDTGEFNGLDGRRAEVIADGLPLWHGAQLAIDTTLVSPLHGDGTARRGAANWSRVALPARVKEATYPEQEPAWWSSRQRWDCLRSINFLEGLGEGTCSSGAHLARTSASRLPSSVEFPLGVQSGESFCSLLELRPVPGTGEEVPPMRDARFP